MIQRDTLILNTFIILCYYIEIFSKIDTPGDVKSKSLRAWVQVIDADIKDFKKYQIFKEMI